MTRKIMPYSWSYPALRFPYSLLNDLGEDVEGFLQEGASDPTGLSLSEDDNKIYVEAHLPGIQSEEIDMTYEKGVLWIKAEKKEETEDKKKKFYRKAVRSFSYQVAVPGDIDETRQPEATCKNGILKVVFEKKQKGHAKKISVKEGR